MGYKTEQFVGKVDDHLICVICQEVLQDPWGCKDGHAFCKECITVWLKTSQICPLDNKPLGAYSLVHNLIAKNMIDNLDVYCHPPENDKKEKCEWTGKLQSLATHRETCPFQQVPCPHVNCNEMMQRRKREDHDKICKYKKVECEKCNKVFVRHVLQTHIDVECPEVLVPCPNGCASSQGQTTKIKRVNLDNHLTNICAKTIVDCPFKYQGCSVQVERQDIDKHVQDNMAAHMMLLAKQCSSHTNENQLLKDELKEVKAELSSVNTRQYTWMINDFPALCDEYPNGSEFESPTFWLCGYKLRLSIYPNGHDTEASEFVSLFLNLCEKYSDSSDKDTNSSNNETFLKYRLSMISQSLFTQDVSVEFTHVFKTPEGYGRSKFIKRADALSAAYCNRTNGSLTIACTILLDKP